ncbi:anticodon-binding protein [Dichotomocladium elegans]|nr:anticodon-binding protein [Dichotomocladium elegans]
MVPDDEGEVAADEATDELASYFSGKTPKIVVTTTYDFCADLVSIFPNTTFAKRGNNHGIKDIIQQSIKHDYTDVMIVNEDRKIPNAITLIHLPNGPSAYFKLSSYTPSIRLPGKGLVTAHNPELILNNFNTRLGHTIGRMFQSLMPQVPEFEGRQVVTFHNQRDFIFVRRHRYIFKDTEKVGLKELGPRFTLKLRWLQKGTYSRDNEYEWIFRPDMETNRKKFFL